MNINTNLLSPATLSYLRAIDPISARALQAAGDLTPPRRLVRHAPRRVIDNRLLLAVILATQNGRSGPAGDEDVIEGEWTELD